MHSEDRQIDQLLTEFRAFRDNEWREFRNQVTEWQQETGERVTKLEAQIKPAILDNGTPSRLTKVEEKQSEMNSYKQWMMGVSAGISICVSCVVGIVAWVVPIVVKYWHK